MVRTTETTMPPGYTLGDFVNEQEKWPEVDEYVLKLYFINPKTKDKWGLSIRLGKGEMDPCTGLILPPNEVLLTVLEEKTEKVFGSRDIFTFPVHTIYEDWDEIVLPGEKNPIIKYRKQILYKALMCEII